MLAKKNRLTKRGSFSYVYRNGNKREGKALKLLYVKSGGLKIGFSVNVKIGKANKRNLIKRRLRAATRELLSDVNCGVNHGWQMVIVAKPAAAESDYEALKREIQQLFNGL